MLDNHDPSVIYDQDIHPLIERIALICKQYDIPLFTIIQDTPNSFRTSCLNATQSERIKDIYQFSQSWDIDHFLTLIIDQARKNGHNSDYLQAMGIPKNPPDKR